eukprot:4958107-Pleurochrysis_carterae.AAC.1
MCVPSTVSLQALIGDDELYAQLIDDVEVVDELMPKFDIQARHRHARTHARKHTRTYARTHARTHAR